MTKVEDRSVMVTGAAGNLGSKLVDFLVETPWCQRVVAVDHDQALLDRHFGAMTKVEPYAVDLVQADAAQIDKSLADIDTVVHFAVLNPLPDSSWIEAAYSFDMTAMLLMASRRNNVRRFVFASSNHAVGQYMMPERRDAIKLGTLTTNVFAPGSRWVTGSGPIIGYAYGAGKIFGERLCLAAAETGGLSTVSIRIGWCQTGENSAVTLDASGNPKLADLGLKPQSDESELRWFRNMWLSNPDFKQLFEKSILAEQGGWPSPGIVINGVSANAGMGWEIASAKTLIGYEPVSNVWAEV